MKSEQFTPTPLQESMQFQHLLDPGARSSYEQLVLKFAAKLDAARMHEAVVQLTTRHMMLRCRFDCEENDQAICLVDSESAPEFAIKKCAAGELAGIIQQQTELGFDLSAGAPIRWLLLYFEHAQDAIETVLLITLHHILMDGDSYATLLTELLALYQHQSLPSSVDNAMPLYAKWVQQLDLSAARAYWKQALDGLNRSEFFSGVMSDIGYKPVHAELAAKLPVQFSASLSQYTEQHQISLADLFNCAWALTLSQISGEDQVIFGVTRLGRNTLPFASRNQIGLFINTIPLRMDCSKSHSLLKQCQAQLAGHAAYQHVPLSDIEACSPLFGRQSIFDSILVFDHSSLIERLHGQSQEACLKAIENLGTTNFPLTVVAKGGPHIQISLHYDIKAIAPALALRCLKQLTQSLLQLVSLKINDDEINKFIEN